MEAHFNSISNFWYTSRDLDVGQSELNWRRDERAYDAIHRDFTHCPVSLIEFWAFRDPAQVVGGKLRALHNAAHSPQMRLPSQ